MRRRVQRQDAGLLDDAEIRQGEVARDAEDLPRAVVDRACSSDSVRFMLVSLVVVRRHYRWPATPHRVRIMKFVVCPIRTVRAFLRPDDEHLSIDRHDLALLDALQRSDDATNAVLGEAVHLSASQVSRRLQRLQRPG